MKDFFITIAEFFGFTPKYDIDEILNKSDAEKIRGDWEKVLGRY